MSDASTRDPRRDAVRNLPAARAVVRAWRRLSGSPGSSLVGCSGGADSTGVLLALWAAGARIVVGHVVHDMRTREESHADEEHLRNLCASLGVEFVSERIEARPLGGNLEATSRRLRYDALARMARSRDRASVVVAHHAQDQAETVVMRLLRGSGSRGLGGMSPRRVLARDPAISLLRPALEVEPAGLREICGAAHVVWREDPTNLDESNFRAAVRARLIPAMIALAPRALTRISSAAELCRESAEFLTSLAREALESARRTDEGLIFRREELRLRPAIVVGECLRIIAAERSPGCEDSLTWAVVRPAALAIRDRKEHRREFRIGASLCIVDAARILIRPTPETDP